jgi:ACS family glucarate transporter-like MFS transporter
MADCMSHPPIAPSRHRYWVLVVLCSLAFLTYLDRVCIMRVQGDIAADLQLGQLTAADEAGLRQRGLSEDPGARAKAAEDRATTRLSWIFSAFVAGYVLFEVPGGWMGDRWGARIIIFRIVLWWSLFTAATGGIKGLTSLFVGQPGPAHWLAVMIAVRFLFGIGEAGAYPNIARALGRWFPLRERATAQSFIWLSSRFGGAIAPILVGGLLALGGDWKRVFWILGAFGVIWAIWFLQWFRDSPDSDPRANEAERAEIRGSVPATGTIYDDSAAAPFRWTGLFSGNALALCLVSFCVSFCFYFYITFLPKYLKDQFQFDYGQSQLWSGLPLFVGGLACLAGGALSDWVIRRTGRLRWGRSIVPIVGWSLAGLCAFTVSQLNSPGAVIALIIVAFAFQDLGVPSMWSLPADIGGRYAGTLGGWMNTAGAVGGMLSPLIAAQVAIRSGWNTAFVMFGAVYLLGALAWLRVDASRPLRVR